LTNAAQLINSSLILKSTDGATGMPPGNKNSIGNRQEVIIESRNYQERPFKDKKFE
jgi:hypothetical protein